MPKRGKATVLLSQQLSFTDGGGTFNCQQGTPWVIDVIIMVMTPTVNNRINRFNFVPAAGAVRCLFMSTLCCR